MHFDSSIIAEITAAVQQRHGKHLMNGEIQFLCPAHEERDPSACWNPTKGTWFCHGCGAKGGWKDLAQRLGIEIPRRRQAGNDSIIATYDYKDAGGKLLYQVCRTVEKRFFQRRPDGTGGWINGLGETKPVLYKLPELLDAVKGGEVVFIPEGEKDADNLTRLGLCATTNPMGAGKWRDGYSGHLQGANVVILPDNDEPGRKHAEQVATSLHGKVVSVKILELPGLPAKGDVSDWLQAGGTRDKLLQLAEECKEWELDTKSKNEKASQKTKKDERNTRQTSFFVDGKKLYEQVYFNGASAFLSFDSETQEAETVPFLELDGVTVEPISGEDVELGAVGLPSGVSEYGDTITLLSEIEAHIYRYLDVSQSYLKFAAYYILLSWVYDRFHTLPYLRALGDTGCGKSRFLDTIGGLCYKAISASGCVTPAPIYRMLRKWGGTLVLDEADMKNSDEYNETVTILNCGFERGRPVLRATKDNPDKIQVLPVYGPKVFATRRRFKDSALEARCLTEIMTETDRDDIPAVLGRQFFDKREELRNKLLLFRLRNYSQVNPEAGATLSLPNTEPRLRQVSESFIALFARETEVLASYCDFIAQHQRELIEQRAATKVGQVVRALFELLDEVTMVTMVTKVTGHSVTNITPGQVAEKAEMTPQAVGQILKGLGLSTKAVKTEGKTERRIIGNEKVFKKLKKRYILGDDDESNENDNAECPVTFVTNVTNVTDDVGNYEREEFEL